MTHFDVQAGKSSWTSGGNPDSRPVGVPNRSAYPVDADHSRVVVHIVDIGDDVQLLLRRWLATAGIGSRIYPHIDAFLNSHCARLPGCLVIDAQPLVAGSIGASVVSSSLTTRYPIVVTAYQADVATAVRAMKTGAIDFVEKPLREREIVTAVCSAIEVDRQQRHIVSRHADLRARFGMLSPRERQVMALVTAGKLNKQTAGVLGVSEITVKAHRGSVMRKMQALSLAELVRMADAIGDDLALVRNGCST